VSLVFDSSVTLAWYFEDERTPAITALLRQVATTGAIVPGLWRLEVANGLLMATRRGRIDPNYREASLTELAQFPIEVDQNTDVYAWTTTLRLTDIFGLTVYDAAYLELAQRLNLPLASLDLDLRAAANGLGIALLGDLQHAFCE
jgi:predicted nucleic acid-binding protein